MTDTTPSPSEWKRDSRTGNWLHPAHGRIERVNNRWRVAGTTKVFYLIGDAQAHAEERTKNRKPEQIDLF